MCLTLSPILATSSTRSLRANDNSGLGESLWSLSNTDSPPARAGWCLFPVWVRRTIFKTDHARATNSSGITVHGSHDWVSLELISMHIRCRLMVALPWTRDSLRRWGDGGHWCVCVWLSYGYGLRSGREVVLVGAEKWNELWPWRAVSSAETPEQPDDGLYLPAWSISHCCIISTPHMSLCGVWGGYRLPSIMTFNRWPTIVKPPPFFSSQGSVTLLTISHLCATDAPSHHAPPIQPRLLEEPVLKVNCGTHPCTV